MSLLTCRSVTLACTCTVYTTDIYCTNLVYSSCLRSSKIIVQEIPAIKSIIFHLCKKKIPQPSHIHCNDLELIRVYVSIKQKEQENCKTGINEFIGCPGQCKTQGHPLRSINIIC